MKAEQEKNFTGWLLRSRLIGRPGIHFLDTRIYNFVLLMSAIVCGLLVIFNIIYRMNIITIIDLTALSVGSAVLYYISMKKKRCYRMLYCMLLLAATVVQWVYNGGGSAGAIQYYFLYVFIAPMIILKGRQRIFAVTLGYLAMLGLIIYEYVDGSLIAQYPDRLTRFTRCTKPSQVPRSLFCS